ncbi:hypothetical protein [Melittangium boletus]|uniref:hypothetical protein n=1 Tax=Melittangium boletus TaxID=83453 RepID=UPI003DA5D612
MPPSKVQKDWFASPLVSSACLLLLGGEALFLLGSGTAQEAIPGLLFRALLSACLSLLPALALLLPRRRKSRALVVAVLGLNLVGFGTLVSLLVTSPFMVYLFYFGPLFEPAPHPVQVARMDWTLPWLILSVPVRMLVVAAVSRTRWPRRARLPETTP